MHADARTRSIIEAIVSRVVDSYAPERVILFGSHAYGSPHRDSDIDLLIIKRASEPFLDRLAAVRRAAPGAYRHVPFEPIVLTPEEVEQRLRAGDQFIAEIVGKGEVLYAA